jgi:uncharacterized protein (TIGR01732 family)
VNPCFSIGEHLINLDNSYIIIGGENSMYGYGYGGCGCGTPGYGGTFVLIVVLFILLIIVGAAWA